MRSRSSNTTESGVALARGDWIAAFQGFALGTVGLLALPFYAGLDGSGPNTVDRRRVVVIRTKIASVAFA
jgi:hypothetical protein